MVYGYFCVWQYLPINEFWKTFTGNPFKSPFLGPFGNCHFDKARGQTELLVKFQLQSADA
jgi:hypothetical protein